MKKLLNNHVPSFSFYLTKEFVDEKQYFEISSLPTYLVNKIKCQEILC